MGIPDISITYQSAVRDRPISTLRIRAAAGDPRRGWLTAAGQTIPVALGRGGIRANKREGDGGTPKGTFRPRQIWWRADRHPRPRSFLPIRAIRPEDAWCEDPASRHYNRPVRLQRGEGGDTTTFMISLSRSITTVRRASPAAAARCSCTWRATILDRPRDASR
jgi:L,D-peptidoglycan transpeptidase YkuD (ErfK/YbiS/YcfS/YnhG family)